MQAACADGALYTLTVPRLQLLSRVSVSPNLPTSLLCSPDLQWVFTLTQNSDLGPKVSAGRVLGPRGLAWCVQVASFVPDLAGCVCEGGFLCRTKSVTARGQWLGSGGIGLSPGSLLFLGCCIAHRPEGVSCPRRGKS